MLPPGATIMPAVASGLLLAAAFPPLAWGRLVFVALVPVHWAVFRHGYTRGEFFRVGYLFGLAFFFPLLWWIKDLLPWANVTIPWLMTPALIVLILYLSLYPAFYFLLLGYASGGRWIRAVAAAPGLWTLVELGRSKGELGFPWGDLGYALSYHANAIQLASVLGLFGLSFFIAVVNVLFASAAHKRRLASRLVFIATAVALIIVNEIWGKGAVERIEGTRPVRLFKVAVVQPDIDLRIKWDPEYTDSIFDVMETMSRQAGTMSPDLLVFPETSAPVYIRYESVYENRLKNVAGEVGVPIFIGFLDARKTAKGEIDIYNSAGLFTPDRGLVSQYDKVHLLPFGEALPLSGRFHFLRRINFGQANFQPGGAVVPVPVKGTSFGPLICFESIFPELSRRHVLSGAGFLVNITNDGWFGDTPGPVQHAQMSIMRAVENRKALVRSANTGISMVVDPAGRVRESLGLNERGTIIAEIPLFDEETFYTRHGETPVILLSLFLLLGFVIPGRRRG
jgi:apolipoprotein N-acyltransferase